MAREKDMESKHGLMVGNIVVIGKMTYKMEKANKCLEMETFMMVFLSFWSIIIGEWVNG